MVPLATRGSLVLASCPVSRSGCLDWPNAKHSSSRHFKSKRNVILRWPRLFILDSGCLFFALKLRCFIHPIVASKLYVCWPGSSANFSFLKIFSVRIWLSLIISLLSIQKVSLCCPFRKYLSAVHPESAEGATETGRAGFQPCLSEAKPRPFTRRGFRRKT